MTDTSREAVERMADTLTGHHIYGGSPLIAEVAATLRALLAEREKEDRFFQSVIRAANDWEQQFLAVSNERDRMREALLRIASPDYGLQAMIEDGVATPKNKAAYYEVQVRRRQNIAHDALKGGEDE